MTLRILLSIAAVTALLAGPASAQQGAGTVMRALDEPISLSLPDTPITLALEKVAATTGLSIRLADDVLASLPHGEETRLRITAENARLRDVLTKMLAPMCLRWRVEGVVVVVETTDAVRRIGRRPTFTEMEILATFADKQLTAGADALEQMRQATGISELELIWHGVAPALRTQATAAADKALPCTSAAYLDRLCHGRDLTWYVWGTDIMVVPDTLQTQRQLRRIVSVHYNGVMLQHVVTDLAHKAGLKVKWDPGVLEAVPVFPTRTMFALQMSGATVAEAFDAISGATGLTFTPDGLAIRVGLADPVATAATPRPTPTRKRSPFVATMPFTAPDGRQFTIMFRPDDLPEEMIDAITAQKAAYIEQLRAAYAPPQPKAPTTQPATTTRPAPQPTTKPAPKPKPTSQTNTGP